jgi:hypothetical protein
MVGIAFGYIFPKTTLEFVAQILIIVTGNTFYINFFSFFLMTLYNMN